MRRPVRAYLQKRRGKVLHPGDAARRDAAGGAVASAATVGAAREKVAV